MWFTPHETQQWSPSKRICHPPIFHCHGTFWEGPEQREALSSNKTPSWKRWQHLGACTAIGQRHITWHQLKASSPGVFPLSTQSCKQHRGGPVLATTHEFFKKQPALLVAGTTASGEAELSFYLYPSIYLSIYLSFFIFLYNIYIYLFKYMSIFYIESIYLYI